MRDALTRLSNQQALTATAVSSFTYDAGVSTPSRDLGDCEPLELAVHIDVEGVVVSAEDPPTTTAETYALQVIQSSNADLSAADVLSSRPLQAAELAAGTIVLLPVPPNVTKRYLGANYVLGGTAPTMTVTTFIQPGSMASLAKPKTYATGSKVH